MWPFKKEEKSGIQCPACGSANTKTVKGTEAVMAYPGFYSGVANDPESGKYMRRCKDCQNVFAVEVKKEENAV